MLCSIMTTVTSRGMASRSFCTSRRSSTDKAGEGLVEQEHFRVLRQRHGDLDAAAFAVGRLRQRPIGDVAEADLGKGFAALRDERMVAVEIDERVPAHGGEAQQRQLDVAQDGVAGEQRDDLVGARHAEMGAVAACGVRDVAAEQGNRAAVGCDLAGNQVEERGLAGAVGTNNQAPLARFHDQFDIGGDAQAAERLAQRFDGQRAHGLRSLAGRATHPLSRARTDCDAARHSRTEPGTRPSGMKLMIKMKITPSTRFQRSM